MYRCFLGRWVVALWPKLDGPWRGPQRAQRKRAFLGCFRSPVLEDEGGVVRWGRACPQPPTGRKPRFEQGAPGYSFLSVPMLSS